MKSGVIHELGLRVLFSEQPGRRWVGSPLPSVEVARAFAHQMKLHKPWMIPVDSPTRKRHRLSVLDSKDIIREVYPTAEGLTSLQVVCEDDTAYHMEDASRLDYGSLFLLDRQRRLTHPLPKKSTLLSVPELQRITKEMGLEGLFVADGKLQAWDTKAQKVRNIREQSVKAKWIVRYNL